LTGVEGRLRLVLKRPEYVNVAPALPPEGGRRPPAEIESSAAVRSFEEVALGFAALDAVAESGRCLRCDVRPGSTPAATAAAGATNARAAREEAVT
jgi:hypothetical protein